MKTIQDIIEDQEKKEQRHQKAEDELQQAELSHRKGFSSLDLDPPVDDESWVTTYMDILTLLLVLFVLLLANADFSDEPSSQDGQMSNLGPLSGFGLVQEDGQLSENELDSIGTDLNDEFADAGLADMVEVSQTPGYLNIQLSDQILFNSGEAVFKQDPGAIMSPIVKVLLNNEYQVSVEGHTDNIPISTAQFPSNWELSSARASFVVRYLVQQGVSPERLRAVGYADSQPLAGNDSADGRQQNRRVTLVLTLPGNG